MKFSRPSRFVDFVIVLVMFMTFITLALIANVPKQPSVPLATRPDTTVTADTTHADQPANTDDLDWALMLITIAALGD